MRKLFFSLVVLILLALCLFEHSLSQTRREPEKLLMNRDAVLPGFEQFGDGMKQLGQPLLQVSSGNSHQIDGDVQVAWVREYGSGLYPASDIATAMAVDKSGNVCVTGYTTSNPIGFDFFTIKYDSSGSEMWIARFNGDANGNDFANAIAIDTEGNVYVTGKSEDSRKLSDYLTIKYKNNGEQQWVRRYNGLGNSTDEATAILIDSSGYIYVTGVSTGIASAGDYATIKYSPLGEEIWVARYNGPANAGDRATAIGKDESDNIYITGWSYSGTSNDFLTIKYSSSGVEQWNKRYGDANLDDWPKDMAVDKTGNVYITGSTGGSFSNVYTTIKYDSNGNELWIDHYSSNRTEWYDGANALAIDDSGNVFVTGGSGYLTNPSFLTIKYSPAGVRKWLARYSSPSGSNTAIDIILDKFGNIYVTGMGVGEYYHFGHTIHDYITLKYNSSGEQQWISRYKSAKDCPDEAVSIKLDNSGNVYVTGKSMGESTNYDFLTVKYNSSGRERWVRRHNGRGNSYDIPAALATDSLGNVYITGKSATSYSPTSGPNNYDYLTIKYNAEGIHQWTARYNGPGNGDDYPAALAIDASGYLYVTGTSGDSVTSSDYATIKYSSDGVLMWIARYNSPANKPDLATSMTVDKSGYIYVTGWSEGVEAYNYDFATIKYDQNGNEEWVARYNGSGNQADYSKSLVVDELGNVYVTGSSYKYGASYDYATVKYNSCGVEQWVAIYNGANNEWDEPVSMSIDGSNNIYVTGKSMQLGVSYNDYITVKYDSAGKQAWVKKYDNNSKQSEDIPVEVVADDFGNVYVAGYSGALAGNSFQHDYATVKYNSDGNEKWVSRYNGPGNSLDFLYALSLDHFGNIYVTGGTRSFPNTSPWNYAYATIKYNTFGNEEWIAYYSRDAQCSSTATAIVIDNSNNVYITGSTILGDYETWKIFTTIKYTQTPTSIKQEILNHPKQYSLSQNYPNPFNPATTIRFALPKESFVTLKIFNLLGQEIATLVDGPKPMGENQVQWQAGDLPSGVYLYRLEANLLDDKNNQRFKEIKKLILLK